MEFWNSLSEEEQKLLRDAMKEAEVFQQQLVNDEEGKQIEEFKKAGTKVNVLTEEQTQVFIDDTEIVRSEYKESLGGDIYDNWIKAIKNSQQ